MLVGSRSSKIQNHAVSVETRRESCDFLTELQALKRKDAQTIAASIVQVVERVLRMVLAGMASSGKAVRSLRVVHVITGDAVNTNDNAYRRVYQHFKAVARDGRLKYFLIGTKCASHQGNLVVVVAICGAGLKKPLDSDLLTATCSRLYKYLAADYDEEFAANLRDHVVRSTKFLPLEEAGSQESQSCIERSRKLVELYGDGVFTRSAVSESGH